MSGLARYFFDETSAVDKSWMCFIGKASNSSSSNCQFISLQQFNRESKYFGLIEGTILISIAFLSIPCNLLAVVNYSRKKMNKELLILIYALCFYNFLNVPIIFIYGAARIVDNFPLSHFGCFLAIPFALAVNNSTTLTLALISYERRQVLERFDDSKNNKGSGLWKIGLMLLSINIFTFSLYCLVMSKFLEIVSIVIYPIHGPNQPPVELCVPKNENHSFGWEITFSFSHFIIPMTVTAYNYCHIWHNSRRLKGQSLRSKSNSHRINAFFARLMIGSLTEFIFFQLPFDVVLYSSVIEKQTGEMRLYSSAIFVTLVFMYTDSVINPLWFSFVTLVKKNGTNMSTVGLELLTTKSKSTANFETSTDC